MAGSMIVSAEWLREHLHDPSVAVVDVRPPPYFIQGHIPSAANLPAFFLYGPDSGPPSGDQLASRLGLAGVGSERHIVAYDDGASPAAARLFWVLTYFRHPQVSVLDGGMTGWLHRGHEYETRVVTRAPATFRLGETDAAVLAGSDDVRAAISDSKHLILDTRSPAEYVGLQDTATRNGHIPGAVNIDWSDNLRRDQNGIAHFLPEDELRRLYDAAGVTGDKEVIVHCQSGSRSSETFLVLKSLGHERVRQYSAGWQEWGNRDDTPVEEHDFDGQRA